MVAGMLTTLTVEQRVLIHLWDIPMGDNPWEGRPELTQAGISAVVGIARKHLPRTLKKLREKGHLVEETRHVPGAKQRCRVYGLSKEGRDAAAPLIEQLRARAVTVDGEESTVGALHHHANTLAEILTRISESGVYTAPGADGEIITVAPDATDLPLDQRLGIYENIVRTAWADGIVTTDEQIMLDDMAMYLGLEPEQTESIEKAVTEEKKGTGDSDHSVIFRQMLDTAWQDGEIDASEQAMLDTLAKMLGLEKSADIQLEFVCDQLDDRLKAYCAAMEAAWDDGTISEDEENMLGNLRQTLKITSSEHRTIEGVVRAKLN